MWLISFSLPSSKLFIILGIFPFLTLVGVLTALSTSQWTLNQQDGWRICVALPVLPSLIILVTLVFVPESPIWLIANKTPMGGIEMILVLIYCRWLCSFGKISQNE